MRGSAGSRDGGVADRGSPRGDPDDDVAFPLWRGGDPEGDFDAFSRWRGTASFVVFWRYSDA